MAVPISSLSLACLAPMLVVRAQGSIIAEIKGRRDALEFACRSRTKPPFVEFPGNRLLQSRPCGLGESLSVRGNARSMKTSIYLIEQIIRAKTALHLKLVAHRKDGKVEIGGARIDDLIAEVDAGRARTSGCSFFSRTRSPLQSWKPTPHSGGSNEAARDGAALHL